METNKFVQTVVGVVVCVIVAVSVAVPIISGLKLVTTGDGATTYTNASIVNTILGIIPVFIIIAILVGVVVVIKAKKD